MSVPSNSSHSPSQLSEITYYRSGIPQPGDLDYGLYHHMIQENPETIINIASHLACEQYTSIKLRDGHNHHLSMGMPAKHITILEDK